MIERDVIVTTKHGKMPSFLVAPDGPGRHPGIIFYMDAPGIREELRNMCRRIAKHGYVCLLPDMYYRLGLLRFDIPRRDDAMSAVIRPAMNSLTNAMVADDSAAMIAFLDAEESVKPGPVGCVGHCMSGRFITTVAARFPHRMAAAASLYGVGIVTEQEEFAAQVAEPCEGRALLRLRRARPVGTGERDPGTEIGAGEFRREKHAGSVSGHASRILLSGAAGVRPAGGRGDMGKNLRALGSASEVIRSSGPTRRHTGTRVASRA